MGTLTWTFLLQRLMHLALPRHFLHFLLIFLTSRATTFMRRMHLRLPLHEALRAFFSCFATQAELPLQARTIDAVTRRITLIDSSRCCWYSACF